MKKVYLIAVIFALIAGFATYLFATEIDKKTTIKDAETVEVIVPINDIAKNTAITEDMFADDAGYFRTRTFIKEDVVENVAHTKDQLLNMVTVDKLYANEAINLSRVEDISGENVALSLKLADGMVAYSFSAASVTSVDGYISEGDSVDVMVTKDNEDKTKKIAEIAYEDLRILRVSTNKDHSSAAKNGSKITEYSTLTVEVTKDQALKLYDIENNYSYKLILNHRTPEKPAEGNAD